MTEGGGDPCAWLSGYTVTPRNRGASDPPAHTFLRAHLAVQAAGARRAPDGERAHPDPPRGLREVRGRRRGDTGDGAGRHRARGRHLRATRPAVPRPAPERGTLA